MSFRRLLVPVDGSDLSGRAMTASIELAQQLGASITGFVAEPEPPLPAVGRHPSVVQREFELHDARTESHANDLLARFEAQARSAGVPFESHHVQARGVDEAIVQAAESRGCDMIVMVTHGRGAFGEFLFGSQTKAVLSRSRLPLLVLH